MTILDTIDNAISDWDTSADAMRWTPDPAQLPARPILLPPTPEQVAAFHAAMQDFMGRVGAQMEAIGEALKGAFASLGPILDEMDRQQNDRRARVSRIRQAYGARRRGW